MSQTIKATNGVIVFVEANKKGEWFLAKNWQSEKFLEVMEFGTMKSMCYPNPLVETEVFTAPNNGQYKFHIHNDWGPVFIENIHTKKKREIKYFELFKNNDRDFAHNLSKIMIN